MLPEYKVDLTHFAILWTTAGTAMMTMMTLLQLVPMQVIGLEHSNWWIRDLM